MLNLLLNALCENILVTYFLLLYMYHEGEQLVELFHEDNTEISYIFASQLEPEMI